MVTKKEKNEAIAYRMRKDIYKHAKNGKCQYWQDVRSYLLADEYTLTMIRKVMGSYVIRDEIDKICKQYYKLPGKES